MSTAHPRVSPGVHPLAFARPRLLRKTVRVEQGQPACRGGDKAGVSEVGDDPGDGRSGRAHRLGYLLLSDGHQQVAPDSRHGQIEQMARYPVVEGHIVGDAKTCKPLPKDGSAIGEILVRGNTVMLGYLKDPKATAEAFAGGWMHTGDLAVWHASNYVEIKDRKKDIIISGGENISSVEVEIALYKHPATQLAAVVARPDDKWGETPCAFIQLKPGASATEAEYIDWCRQNLARYKVPKKVVFGPVPTTATGKIQKYVLREKAKQL